MRVITHTSGYLHLPMVPGRLYVRARPVGSEYVIELCCFVAGTVHVTPKGSTNTLDGAKDALRAVKRSYLRETN